MGNFEIERFFDNDLDVRVRSLGFHLSGPSNMVAQALSEMFSDMYYHEASEEGRVIVDVWAFIGDSPLFFAARGARTVYAYEASQRFLQIARRNVSQFPNIVLDDFGLGCSDASAHLASRGTLALSASMGKKR
jgi:predicted RNA methylase